MKKIVASFIAAAFIMTACNDSGKGNADTDTAQADSLMDQVMEGHDIGMAKTPRLSKMKDEAKRWIDSIGKLPARAQEATAPLKARLDSLIKDLEYADYAMDRWMRDFNYDSFKTDMKERIKYLSEEKLKVEKVKEAILGSLQKADSLLKPKS